jgi:uncharacterized membrane protein YhaH (DUF805 family)
MNLNRQLNPRFAFWSWVVWTAICVAGVILNGGFGPMRNTTSLWLGTLLCALLVFFSVGALVDFRVRRLVLRPDAQLSGVRSDLVLVAAIGSILFLACVGSLAR